MKKLHICYKINLKKLHLLKFAMLKKLQFCIKELKTGILKSIKLWGADMFKRKVYDKLSEWKEKYSDRYAVLLEGARRVGKRSRAGGISRQAQDH